MRSTAEGWAFDTSVAVASLDPNHEAHATCRRALVKLRPALAGHAAFETYAVLTRLPPPARLAPAQASEALRTAFPERCWLGSREIERLWAGLENLELAGGSVYDALIAAAARAAHRQLLTRDRRAQRVYQAVGIDYQYLD